MFTLIYNEFSVHFYDFSIKEKKNLQYEVNSEFNLFIVSIIRNILSFVELLKKKKNAFLFY